MSESAAPHPRTVLCSRSLISVLLGGQLLSLLISGTGVFSTYLANRGVNIPTSQSFVNYLTLSLCILPKYFRWRKARQQRADAQNEWMDENNANNEQINNISHTNGFTSPSSSSSSSSSSTSSTLISSDHLVDTPSSTAAASPSTSTSFLSIPLWQYFILAACDVEGNFLLVKAYQYTTLTSVQLLDCFTIPVVMILSRVLMKTVYNRKHLIGATICVIGLTLLVASDIIGNNAYNESTDRFLGDVLVLLGCVFYGISNIGQEYAVKSFDRFEYLGMIGICGSIISAVQMIVVEREALREVDFGDSSILGYLFGFNLCLFCLYYSTPILLMHASAVFMNLSFLTSDFWTILFAVNLFEAHLHPLYFLAFTIIIIGLLLYNLAGVEGGIGHLLRELCQRQKSPRQQLSQDEDHPSTHHPYSSSSDHHTSHHHYPSTMDQENNLYDEEDPTTAAHKVAPSTHAHTRTSSRGGDGFEHQPIRDLEYALRDDEDDEDEENQHRHFNRGNRESDL